MKTETLRIAGIACALGLVGAPRLMSLQTQDVEPKPVEQRVTADQLIARVIDARDTSGFRARAKLTRMSAAGAPVVRQLVIKCRTESGVTTMLYQVAWPEALAGEAVEVELGHPSRGFIYQHGAVTQLEAGQVSVRVFASDLHVEDLTQAFWDWTSRRLGAAGTVGNRPCRTVDLRPPADVGTEYSLIKACISAELSLPLQIEYYGGDGQLMKRAVVGGTVKMGQALARANNYDYGRQ
jgi:hypothetical protein